ncbi:P-loop containing nucleoside triphosphate hydrolase protein [Aaosphaeria arxii CBS 175.79]|uniref:P-loop containing nucleoside triphosphate hydrolase protein n=1 Tax=Aaosphaeria arxii CBS 175.79 TaxID=1450172 RepID=A0A6A5YB40_9PLEO|nr:P-loop containing nucleoside triphosphate hydrolase protein [Aaosphaeria arxii CBS 175.79]KAF2022247.1 P-loop containing nucleoside triphosphate hydrolase protein [Aaosphaeria arxii CBS 175.79]
MTGNSFNIHANEDQTSREYFHHSSAQRINTDAVIVEALRRQYPDLDIIAVPQGTLNLIAYASAGYAKATPLDDTSKDPVYGVALKWRSYAPPGRRLDNGAGAIVEQVLFGKYLYKWKDQEFILYIANGRDGFASYPDITVHYILTRDGPKVNELIKEATVWGVELHDEVWVFDQGWWQKSRELWNSVAKSQWSDVILDEGMKKAIISDVENFFDHKETYEKLRVPWKRGILYYGPPGNGKTISIKAMMHSLYQRGKNDNKQTVPTLYVRSLASIGGPEYALRSIFAKARETAPCYLVFEDLDSVVDDRVRSYFLNEVDGLKSNDGILMVGSTNHLDRLDPGISKRPSRFDRKYYFPDPNYEQRVQYAKYWQGKLKDNDDIEFPDAMCPAIAKITDKFSFAYMQEAFVASLLAIAVRKDASDAEMWAGPLDPLTTVNAAIRISSLEDVSSDPDLAKLELWREIQKQVHILREEMDEKSATVTRGNRSGSKELREVNDPKIVQTTLPYRK